MRPEDAFWGARLVSRFTADDIAAIVAKGEYSDPAATAYVTKVLIERQRKVLATWLNVVTPLVDPVVTRRRRAARDQRRRGGRRRRSAAALYRSLVRVGQRHRHVAAHR